MTGHLWPALVGGSEAASDPARGELGFWRSHRLRPIRSILDAYHRIFEKYGERDHREKRRLRAFQAETVILAEALCDIADVLGAEAAGSDGVPFPPFGVVTKGDPAHGFATAASKHLRGILGGLRGAVRPEKAGMPRPAADFVRWSGGSGEPSQVDARRFITENTLHFLWNSVLKRYAEETDALLEAGELSDVEERRKERQRAVERALWLRTPEVRLLVGLLDFIPRPGPGSQVSPRPREADGRRSPCMQGPARGMAWPGDVVTVLQVNGFWWRDEDPIPAGKTNDFERPPDGWYVIGDHDFLLREVRFSGVEALDRRVASASSGLPDRPRHSFLQCLDYLVCGVPELAEEPTPSRGPDEPGGRPEPEAASGVQAFLQIRPRAAYAPEELARRITDGMPGNVRWVYPLLDSFGWDDYAFFVGFETFGALAEFLRFLEVELRLRSRTINILHREQAELHEERFRERVNAFEQRFPEAEARDSNAKDPKAVVFVTRFRCSERGEGVDDRWGAADGALKRLFGPSRAEHIHREVRRSTGHDDLELYLEFAGGNDVPAREIVHIYWSVLARVSRACAAFDIRTTILLPDCAAPEPLPDDEPGAEPEGAGSDHDLRAPGPVN